MCAAEAKTALAEYGLHVHGEDRPSESGATFDTVNPTTGSSWAKIAEASSHDVDDAVNAAHLAFREGAWGKLSPARRGRLMARLGELIAENAEELAAVETRDNGKLYREMIGQLQTVPEWLYYFGGLADKIEGRTIPVDRPGVFNYTRREPLGVVGMLTPFNSPIFMAITGLAPAMAAGNAVVIKPSEFSSASTLMVAQLAREAGFPPGAINVVTGGRATGEALVAHPLVAKVVFTGSTQTGRAIARAAGERLAGVTLELGGKSATIVFADADLDVAEEGVASGVFGGTGQMCIAGTRALVQRPIYDEFVERLVARATKIVVGDPMDPASQMGPVATQPQLDKMERLIADARDGNGRLLTGGGRAAVAGFPDGYFYEPTIVEAKGNDLLLAREEAFGPVLTVIPFDGDDEAVAIANASEYGLAAGLWTRDVGRVHRLAGALEAGTVWVNMYRTTAPNSPVGGYKASGLGRQNGAEAVDEFLQTKSVWLDLNGEPPGTRT